MLEDGFGLEWLLEAEEGREVYVEEARETRREMVGFEAVAVVERREVGCSECLREVVVDVVARVELSFLVVAPLGAGGAYSMVDESPEGEEAGGSKILRPEMLASRPEMSELRLLDEEVTGGSACCSP